MAIGKNHYHPQRNPHGYHHVLLDESGRAEIPGVPQRLRRVVLVAGAARSIRTPRASAGTTTRPGPTRFPNVCTRPSGPRQTAVNFVENYSRPEPFFLKVSFVRPHSPYDPPERFWKRYAGRCPAQAQVGDWAAKYAPATPPDDIWHGDLGAAQVRHSRQGYYALGQLRR